jgi:AbrB family looped-hinge helix DNA binding protein
MDRIFSTVSSRGRVTIPRTTRDELGIGPGDRLAYRCADGVVVIEKAHTLEADPFACFVEWASLEDDRAFAEL